jgi:polysaccharide deacetylase 2 family uncharacterized protein YibQ
VGLYFAPRPPPAPVDDDDAERVRARMAGWIARDVQAWRERHGDHRIAWEAARGHIAIVIDDVGRELHLLEQLQALRWPLTFSILPGSIYARGSADRLVRDRRRYREIILHLPMEPDDPAVMRGGPEAQETFLLTGDSAETIQAKVDAAFARVPEAVGFNNHMGSRLTADRRAMDHVFAAVRGRDVFFLDSRTTPLTVGAEAAETAGIPAVARKVFLDHDPDPAAIGAAFEAAVDASEDEPVVVIAHPSAAVVAVLRDGLPRIDARGIGVYPLSEVVARRRGRLAASRH